MNAIRHRIALASLVAAIVMGLAAGACSKAPTGPGQLKVAMVDAQPLGVDQIWVNVTKVTAHSTADGWITVATNVGRVDLLSLQNSPLTLGTVTVGAGRITQLRLYVEMTGNEVHVTGDPVGAMTPLKVPSGFESGIKILGPWLVTACDKTTVTIDFDGLASLEIHPTGTGNEWILRPVIKPKKTDTSPVQCQETGGTTCDPETPCNEGEVCVNGKCGPAKTGGGVDSSCTTPGDCLSESCVNGKCAQSPPTGACRTNDDCTNHDCQPDGSCAPCKTNTDCPAGQVCSTGGMCTSNL